MLKTSATSPVLPEPKRLSEGLDASDDLADKSIKPVIVKRSAELKELAALDVEFSPIVDRAVEGYGSAKAAAIDLGHSETHISYQRDGKKSTPVRDLGRLWKKRAAFIASVEPIAAVHGLQLVPIQRLTRDQLLTDLLRFMLESGPLLKLFIREVATRRGVEADEVLRALEE